LELLPSKNGEKDYFIFQYVEGMTLQSLVQKKQILSEQQLLQIVKSVLAGLKDLHRSGTLGRCISINSIMLTPSNQAVLMEFGFAP
jgi:serine/threonine-protein kinase